MKKIISVAVFGLILAATASAHVVVRPETTGIGAFQVFNMGVPSEKDMSTIAVKLMLPEGLTSVTPNVKAGWKIEVKKTATGKKITNEDGQQVDEMKPTEIDWTGGVIPAGQRDEFRFQAQVPATPTTLAWKAYQTYRDGSVVAWDEAPAAMAKSPYSVTRVLDDLSSTGAKQSWWQANQINLTLGVSLLALVISLAILIKHKQ